MRLAPSGPAAICGAAFGAAAWAAAGHLAVDTRGPSPHLLALLPSPAFLLAAVAAGVLLAAWAVPRGTPWALFLLPASSGVAWTTLAPVPVAAAWAGPAAVIPLALVLAGVLLLSVFPGARAPSAWDRPHVAAVAAAVWLGILTLTATAIPITGDEPHYLLATESLIDDGDLDLANNYTARTYRSFYGGVLEPRHVALGVLGQEYSFHGPALSILVLPGFLLGGAPGARIVVMAITAIGAGFLWAATRRLTGSAGAAWAGWAAMCASAPFAFHGLLLYPDGIGAAITAAALCALVTALQRDEAALGAGTRVRSLTTTPSVATAVGAGVVLALLPWLHIRLSLTAGVVGLAFLWALVRGRRDAVLPFLAAPVISAVLWIASTWVMFGTPDPTAVFRQKAAGSLAALPVGTLGLLFDAEYGLLTYAPALAISALGLAAMWRRAPVVAVTALALVCGTCGVAASWVWWGGDSAPARLLVPVIPALGLAFACWWARAPMPARMLAGAAVTLNASLTLLMAVAGRGQFVVNAPDGRGTIFEWLSASVDVSRALPSLFRAGATPGSEALVAATWAVTAGLAWSAALVWQRTERGRGWGRAWLIAASTLVLWLTAGGAVAWRQRDEPPWTPGRGQLRLLQAAASPFWTTAMTGPWPLVVSRDTLVSALDIAMPADAAASTLLHLPFVPAGRYRIHVEPPPRGAGAPPAPSLDLELGRDARPYATWPADAPDRAPAFVLAAPIWSVRVAAHGQERPWTGAVRLQPLLVTPASVPGFAVRATRYADLVVYALDTYSRAEADGLRLTTDRTAHLLVTDLSGEAVSYALTLASDTAGMTVRVERGAFNRTAHIEDADREVRIAVPAADGAADLVVTVTASDEVQSGRGRDAVVARVSRR